MSGAKKIIASKPNIFEYHDYVEFLRDHLEFLKLTGMTHSPRALSIKSGLSPSYLQKFLQRKRTLTHQALSLLEPHIGLNQQELSFFTHLRDLSEAKSQEDRLEAFKKIRRFGQFQGKNKKSLEAHKYLTAWYYFAIREMSHLPDFQLDEVWIRKKLKYAVSLSEIRECLRFLLEHKYIELTPSGEVIAPQKPVDCTGGIYRLALSQFHQQILELGINAIFDTERELRWHTAHTMAIPEEAFSEVRDVMSEALQKVQEISARKHQEKVDQVFQVSFLAFPLINKEAS